MQDTQTTLRDRGRRQRDEPRARGAPRLRPRPGHRGLRVGHRHGAGHGGARVPGGRPAIGAARRRVDSAPVPSIKATAVVGSHLTVRTGSLLTAFLLRPPSRRASATSRSRPTRSRSSSGRSSRWRSTRSRSPARRSSARSSARATSTGPGRPPGACSSGDPHGVRRRILSCPAAPGPRPALHRQPAPWRCWPGGAVVRRALQPIAAAVFVLDGILIGAGDSRYLAAAMVVATVRLPARRRVRLGGRRRAYSCCGPPSPSGWYARLVGMGLRSHRPVARRRCGTGRLTPHRLGHRSTTDSRQSAEEILDVTALGHGPPRDPANRRRRSRRIASGLAPGGTKRFPLPCPSCPLTATSSSSRRRSGVSDAERMAARTTDGSNRSAAIDARRRRARPDRARALAGPRARPERLDLEPEDQQIRSDVDPWGRSEHMRGAHPHASTTRSTGTGSGSSGKGFEHGSPRPAARCSSRTTPARSRPTPRSIMHGIEKELGRPVYGLAEYLFRALPVLGTLWSRVGGVTAHPDNAYRLLHDERPARARVPRRHEGHRQALHRPLPAAALRPRRVRRDRDAGRRARHPDRGRRRRGVDADPVQEQRAWPSCSSSPTSPSPRTCCCSARSASSPTSRPSSRSGCSTPVHFDVPPDQERYSRSRVMEESERDPPDGAGRALRHAAPAPQRLVRVARVRVLVTGLSTFWGGRSRSSSSRPRRRRGRRRCRHAEPPACRSNGPSSCAPTRRTRSSPASCAPPRSTRSCTRTSIVDSTEFQRPRAARDQRDRHDEPAGGRGCAGSPVRKVVLKSSTLVYGANYRGPVLLPRGDDRARAGRAPASSARCSRSRRSSVTSPTTTRT